jgi:hypothetical protein
MPSNDYPVAGQAALNLVMNAINNNQLHVVFKGSVYRTEKRPLTELNWTDINQTSGYG